MKNKDAIIAKYKELSTKYDSDIEGSIRGANMLTDIDSLTSELSALESDNEPPAAIYQENDKIEKPQTECKHLETVVRYGIKQCADCGYPFSLQQEYDKLVLSPCCGRPMICERCLKRYEKPKEAEERKTAEEIYLSKVRHVDCKTNRTFIYMNDAIEAMHEYASQNLPELTDEEIEKEAWERTKHLTNTTSDKDKFIKGAKWYKSEIRKRI